MKERTCKHLCRVATFAALAVGALVACTPASEPRPAAAKQRSNETAREPTPAPSAGKTLTFADISGYVVPGLAHLAKRLGYTSCKNAGYALICSNESPPDFFGVPVRRAVVNLDRGNHVGLQDVTPENPRDISGAPLDDLTYNSIELEFAPQTYDQACLDKINGSPIGDPRCAAAGTIEAAITAFEKEGWVLVSDWKGNRSWMHPEANASISDPNHGSDEALTVAREDASTVREMLATRAREIAEETARVAEQRRLVDEMER